MSTPLRPLLRAELLRVRAQPWTAGVVVLVVLLAAVITALVVGLADEGDLRGRSGTRTILGVAGAVGYPAAYVLGVLGTAGELRHGSIRRLALVAPDRWPIAASKVVSHLALGALVGLAAFVACLAVALPYAGARDAGLELDGLALRVGLGAVLASALFGVLGVGVSLLVRGQVPALVGGLVWIFVVDVATVAVTSDVGRWLPGGASYALIRAGGEDDALSMGAGGVVLLAYAAVVAGAGTLVLVRRRRLA